ncbi:MAG: hypothetical protein A2X13_08730 [Bacteroidetes bacterium GWC2_33_15]|nr:MAG: hypothetical protein A2X10_14625 [Bacteroidetes bacterium GWA2_33_15]OFX51337.1 MAG: hypothetical protein A2X13_08730 [Bacteroidetes bacterium GWC2_33_15]OFX65116.1 MAG: hypothetical protein A2X15_06895 [Bacteroidetes bacterium GWB2_32_14]OFX70713.1 MAG: hypothetical protein A2X14_11105 [Bacteroidetes bacterium GWD2_33_33]HAN18490.1 glutamine cyclotransferase [Bacteroidales bacterium]
MRTLHKNILVVLFFSLIASCSNKTENKISSEQSTSSNNIEKISVLAINAPKAGELFTIGDNIPIDITLNKTELKIDSLIVEDEKSKTSLNSTDLKYTWQTKNLKTGNNQLRVYAYSGGNRIDSYYLKLRFRSDVIPELLECKIIKSYPHDKKAYTQGLIFENGIMYEGTGQYGESVLRKTDFETGKLLAELSLPAQYFGEGITSFGDKIIQLTWTSNLGFVYDKNSFKLLTTLQYSTQGWGLTNDGRRLIMSDGSSTIYFLDPEYFTQTGSIDIYDNNGPVKMLNELEYIDGLVYANVYQTEEIIAFDPETGKVLKRIDCRKIIPDGYKGEQDNVLNGIACDSKTGKIFITGKRWPKLFEVNFIQK